jgi:SNF2 family DNA or RNA helicase
MMSWVGEVVRDQGEQAVIFTFFAQSILPLLQRSLENDGYTVSVNHGQLSKTAKDESKRSFKEGETQIFLTSDSGQRGINLPTAGYLLHYELPSTHSAYIQRSNRIHRIDSQKEGVFIYSLIARNTIEEGFAGLRLRRNKEQDILQGDIGIEDEEFISAEDRKMLLKIGRQNT